MAQRITGINVRRSRAATKKQRAEEAKIEIEKLTAQLGELRGKLTEVTEQREAMTLPNLEGRKVEHQKISLMQQVRHQKRQSVCRSV